MRRALAGLAALVALACGSEASGPPASAPPPPRSSTVPSTRVALPTPPAPTAIVGLDDPPPVADDVLAAGPLADRAAPPHGCVLVTDAAQPVLEQASATAVALAGDAFVVAAYAGAPEQVGLARIAPGGAPSLLGRIELGGGDASRRSAPPGLARLGEATMGVALVDASGGVRLARFELGTPAPVIQTVQVTSSGADARYAPALAEVDAGTLVAWTEPVGTTAHVRLVIVDAAGVVGTTVDVTPEAASAAAPRFDAAGTLYFIDARAGISVVHRVPLGDDGAPGESTVAQPLNLTAEPPSFVVVGDRLGYTAVGNAATRAVGLVTLGSSDRAQPLVPGTGYGDPLTVDGAPLGHAALFAMEAPSGAEPTAPHETRVRVVAPDGTIGPVLEVPSALAPRVAVASSGIVAIASRGAGIRWARCAE